MDTAKVGGGRAARAYANGDRSDHTIHDLFFWMISDSISIPQKMRGAGWISGMIDHTLGHPNGLHCPDAECSKFNPRYGE